MAKCVVFDLDGTLIDSVPDLAAALNRVMAARGLAPFDHDAVKAMVGDGAKVLLEYAFAARGLKPDAEALRGLVGDYVAHAGQNARPYPGVADTLDALRDDGWLLAVCTNKPERSAVAELQALGLSEYFAAICGGDTFPMRKPDPGHLLGTLRAAGGDPARSVMVGDHHNDIHAGRGVGAKTIWVEWGYGRDVEGADATARRFGEVVGIVAGFGIG